MTINPSEEYKKLQDENSNSLRYEVLAPLGNNIGQEWTQSKQSYTETKTKPTQVIQQSLEQDELGCIKVWTATNIKKPSQFVLNLRFASEEQAASFKKNYCEKSTAISPDGKTITLLQAPEEKVTKTSTDIQNRTPSNRSGPIQRALEKLGIDHYGSGNTVPMLQALQQEHQRQTTLNTSRFFGQPEKENPVLQLIKTLCEQPEANASFFHKSLINFLKELPPVNPLQLMTKIKYFTQAISTHAVVKGSDTELLVHFILDPETKNPCDLIDKLNTGTTEEITPKPPSIK